jgi:hypothetical protein
MRKRPLSATVEGPGFVTGEADIGEKVLAATWLSGAASHVLAIASPGEWQSSAKILGPAGTSPLAAVERPRLSRHCGDAGPGWPREQIRQRSVEKHGALLRTG